MTSLVRTLFLAVIGLWLLPSVALGQDRFFTSDGVSIRYIDQGKGEPVVLVHGQGLTLDIWTRFGIADNLARDYRVIALDLRGHGKSAKPHDPKAYGREMGLDIVRLLDHLAIARAHVVGYSLGGYLVSQLLTLRPERFLTATLVAGPGVLSWSPGQAADAELEASERERECVSRTLLRRLAPPGGISDEAINALGASCFADPDTDRFAIAAMVRGRGDWLITTAAAVGVRVPTLGIVGSVDPLQAGMQELKRLRPDMTLTIVEGATHGSSTDARGILRKPEFLGSLRRFLADHAMQKGTLSPSNIQMEPTRSMASSTLRAKRAAHLAR